ncbi:gamma-glutamyl-gamma-aminobutyrate hydrolase family protein [Fictibacillus iocasae]|uniref:Gamma-glutamyl-gamma-aminobutyrate hydrolase family protein n=1 Tax=Fictibacillus iocasae TaxID=2715437 RepID=A0ABW2NLF1_9BACL
MKPIIGITSSTQKHNGLDSVSVHQKYVDSVITAGGIPFVLPIGNRETAKKSAEFCDGILLSGGEDLNPVSYDETPHPDVGKVNSKRDDFEIALVKYTREQKKPIFAICRGIASLNVALGGKLIQDVHSQLEKSIKHYQEAARGEVTHHVKVEKESLLHEITGQDELQVNSFHHQAVGRLADELKVSAKAPDGVIEAIEGKSRNPMMLAVQWHPEEMAHENEDMHKLFKAFVQEATKP